MPNTVSTWQARYASYQAEQAYLLEAPTTDIDGRAFPTLLALTIFPAEWANRVGLLSRATQPSGAIQSHASLA